MKKEVYLSASRIKTAQQCSWLYWCKYILKLPDTSNDGASKGWICHLVFEVLGKPGREKYLNEIVKQKTAFCIDSVSKMIKKHADRLNVNTEEHITDMDKMIIRGLTYDFSGQEGGEIEKEFSEKEFNLKIDDGAAKYNIRGFIDKLFLYKNKTSIIRDFKTSKQKFKGKEISDNLQDFIYCLAIKKLFPEYKSISEFIFLKFDIAKNMFGEPGSGVIRMNQITDEVLEGFELELTDIQNYLENFSKRKATSNFASEQRYPKDGTFGGPLSCGKDGFKMCRGETVKDQDGKPIKAFICSYRKPFEYLCLINEFGDVKKSVFLDEEPDLIKIKEEGDTIEKRQYSGCPAWNVKDTFEL